MKGKPVPVTELVIEHSPGQSPGAVSLVARLGDTVLHADELSITSAVDRQRFIEQLCASRPGVDREAVETELLSIVGHVSRRPGAPKRNQATELVGLAADVELFHTPGGCDSEGYATFRVGDHCETWPINAKGFRQWLSRQFYGENGKVSSSQALQDAMTLLAGEAIHGRPEYPVAVRIAEHHGAIWPAPGQQAKALQRSPVCSQPGPLSHSGRVTPSNARTPATAPARVPVGETRGPTRRTWAGPMSRLSQLL